MQDMNLNTKLEVAVEIIASKIATASNSKETEELLKERDEMYAGNENTIDKIIKEYGPEIKTKYRKA